MVRIARKDDIEEINNLGKLINNDFEKLFSMDQILNENFSKVFVYEEKGIVIGFLHVTVLYESVDIINLCVSKDHRKKHIASNLLDYLFACFHNEKMLFSLEVRTDNYQAISLYEKFGFEIIHTRNNYYKDAYLMGRKNYNE